MDMTTILTPPWPKSLSEFVVACLSWDPRKRPTSVQCLNHEYFKDVERYLPLREMMPGNSPSNITDNSTTCIISQFTTHSTTQTKSKGIRN
jgi:serine/threonine protein kinase